MNSSRHQSASRVPTASPENAQRTFSEIPLFLGAAAAIPGALADGTVVRTALTEAIRRSTRSRQEIAEAMSFSLGQEVTVRQLNAWTAESREDCRFPAEFDRAFCAATADDGLLRCRAELAGYRIVSKTESALLDLGRQYLIRQRAAEQIEILEKTLQVVSL